MPTRPHVVALRITRKDMRLLRALVLTRDLTYNSEVLIEALREHFERHIPGYSKPPAPKARGAG